MKIFKIWVIGTLIILGLAVVWLLPEPLLTEEECYRQAIPDFEREVELTEEQFLYLQKIRCDVLTGVVE